MDRFVDLMKRMKPLNPPNQPTQSEEPADTADGPPNVRAEVDLLNCSKPSIRFRSSFVVCCLHVC